MSTIMTISLEVKDKNDPLYKQIMSNLTSDSKAAGVNVYAATVNSCLHKQIEEVEDCLDNSAQEDLAYDIACALGLEG